MNINRIKISAVIAIIGITSLLIGTSYALFNTVLNSDKNHVIKVGSIAVKYTDLTTETNIGLEELTDDEGINSEDYYSFKIENIGSQKAYYEINLVDNTEMNNSLSQVLDDKYIRSSIEIDGVKKPVVNIEETGRVIYQDILDVGASKTYKLRLWLNFDGLTATEKQSLLKQKIYLKIKVTASQPTQNYEKYTITNLVQNASFENTGWACPSYSTTYKKYGNYSCAITGTTSIPEYVVNNSTNIQLNNTHIYYSRVEAYLEKIVGDESFDSYWPIQEPNMGAVNFDTVGSWKIYSNRTNRSSFANGSYPFRVDYNNNYSNNTVYYDGAMLLDLTEIFGAGNEPTKEWLDLNIPFVEGTSEISIPV